ncbi:uncharacterized protein LOC115771308 isoform X1 [Drosophila novamexicana]|nr:uncharacterized protein LOC115771308 isoform X1 [Drosophila novamexicana]
MPNTCKQKIRVLHLFITMTEEITGNWSYYVYISLTLVPVYLAFQLIKFLGWQLFVNN